KKGEVARSKEYNTTLVLLSGAIGLIFLGPVFTTELFDLTKKLLTLDSQTLISEHTPMLALYYVFKNMFIALGPFLSIILVVTIMGATVVGGWSFSFEAISLKFERLDPIKGLQKIVS